MTNNTLMSTKSTKGPSTLKNPTYTPKREIFFRARENYQTAHRKYYVKDTERRELISEVKETGLILYEYFLSLISRPGSTEITDDDTAAYFGWDLAKVRRVRQNLIRFGWFRSESFTYSGGRKGSTYYIGKEAVEASHARNNANFQLPQGLRVQHLGQHSLSPGPNNPVP